MHYPFNSKTFRYNSGPTEPGMPKLLAPSYYDSSPERSSRAPHSSSALAKKNKKKKKQKKSKLSREDLQVYLNDEEFAEQQRSVECSNLKPIADLDLIGFVPCTPCGNMYKAYN